MRLAGRIYTIENHEHSFWLELERDLSAEHVSWILHMDAIASTPRKARDAIITYDDPNDVQWTTILAGHAEVSSGTLAVITGLTSLRILDVPDLLDDVPRDRRYRRRPSRSPKRDRLPEEPA